MEENTVTPSAEADDKSNFAKGSIPRTILRLALPMTMAQFISVAYSMVDRIYLGRLAGAQHLALTGVGITLPIILIVTSFAYLCGMGGGPLFAISRGKGNDQEAERIMGNSFTLLLIFGIVLTVTVITLRKPILFLFGASEDTYPFAGDYLMFYTMGTIFNLVKIGMNPFINAQGFGKFGMMTIALGALINIVLDPIFIFALGMGARGAGLATTIAQFCSAVWVMRFLTGKKVVLRLKLSCMKLQAKRVRSILTLGMSGFFMTMTTSFAQIVCNVTLQRYGGDLYVGAMAVVNSLREVMFAPMQGISGGASPVLGFNYGAGMLDRVRRGIRFSALLIVGLSSLMWLVLMIAPSTLIRAFNTNPELIRAGIPAIRIYFSMFIFMSMQLASQPVFVALGMPKHSIFFAFLRKAFIAVPLTLLLPMWGMGTNGVFIAEAASQLLGGLACFSTMYFVVYRKLKTKAEN